jgi:DegV family protein with EDD domain
LTWYKMGGVDLGLVTDSASDLSPKVLQDQAVGLVPVYVHVGGRRYKDWQELTPDALYQAIRAGAEPVTEPPSVEDFAEVYERHPKVYDRILSIHVSGELSKTVDRARQAALQVAPTRIRVVDSGMVSAGLGAMVLRAVEMLKRGAEEEEVVREMERMKRSSLYFSVADLSHLARNGRLPRFGEVVGNLLGLRPILRIEKGHIRFLKVARENAVPEALAGLVLGEFRGRVARITIAHTDARSEWLDSLKRNLESALRLERGRITRSGATIAANVGLGALAVHAYALE